MVSGSCRQAYRRHRRPTATEQWAGRQDLRQGHWDLRLERWDLRQGHGRDGRRHRLHRHRLHFHLRVQSQGPIHFRRLRLHRHRLHFRLHRHHILRSHPEGS
jgi:hypothetical protein